MLRTFFWLFWLFLYLVVCLPFSWKAKRLEKQGKCFQRQVLVERRVRKWSAALLRHIGISVTVHGQENLPSANTPVVFVSNHQSYLDIPILLAFLNKPHPLMAKKSLGQIPLFSTWMRLLGCIFVDRDDFRASVTALKQAEEMVRDGRSIIIFAEGTRSKSDLVGTFKSGAMRVATNTDADIIPVVIDGSFHALEEHHMRVHPAAVRLLILPAVSTKNLDRSAQKSLAPRLEEMVRTAKNKPSVAVFFANSTEK